MKFRQPVTLPPRAPGNPRIIAYIEENTPDLSCSVLTGLQESVNNIHSGLLLWQEYKCLLAIVSRFSSSRAIRMVLVGFNKSTDQCEIGIWENDTQVVGETTLKFEELHIIHSEMGLFRTYDINIYMADRPTLPSGYLVPASA